MIKRCEYCGKEKEYKYPSQAKRFCSHRCSNNYKWENIRKRAEYIKLNCPICNKEIVIYQNDNRIKNGNKIYCSKECSHKAMQKGQIINCLNCNKQFYSTRNKCCCKQCAYEYKKKHYNHKTYKEGGYLCRYIGGYNKKGNVKEHRYIMEQYLGRKLNVDEIVHHIDGNKLNNKISNLEIMTRSEHSRLHRLKELNAGKVLFKRNLTIKEI